MSKKFRCGRLLKTKDGRIKKVDLGNGGGTRTCDWPNDNMNFDDVHHQLLTVFALTNKKHQTELYDFKHQPLDVKQFPTFADYMKQYGLNKNSTVVYLCMSEMTEKISKRTEVENIVKNPPVVVKNEPELIPAEDYKSLPSSSSSEYSFTDASLDLTKNIRELISQSPSNKILAQLFENLCLIHGHVFSIILPLQQLNEHSKESEKILYLHNLNNIYDVFESTKTLLHRNQYRFRHTQLFSHIETTFLEFHKNVQVLRDRWIKTEETSEHMDTGLTSSDIAGTSTTNSSKSLSRKSRKKQQHDSMKIFKPLLSTLQYLLRSTKARGLSSFQTFIHKTIGKVKLLRTKLNLSDQASIDHAKPVLLTIKNQLIKKQREINIDPTKSSSDRAFYRTFSSVMRVIRSTLTILYSKQIKITQGHQEITSKS